MKTTIEYKRFFAYSEDTNKCFNTEFKSGINVIYGKNTSGKSTLIQAIHYTFGINDEKHKLAEVLKHKVIFRLDFLIKKDFIESVSILRDNDFIFIKRKDQPIKKFTGISGNKAEEHKHLKDFLSDLFGFNLHLETSGEYKVASLEAMFLPYYVAQDYGWVLALKSFRGLDFFRNFKNDYYDYYLGITNEYDRLRKQVLELKKKNFESEINFLVETEQNNDEIKLSKLKDEAFVSKASFYIENYKINKAKLITAEKEYLIACNKLTFLEERLKVLKKVKIALKLQNPIDADCPTCSQKLQNSIEKTYQYFQDLNDTDKQIKEIDKNSDDLKKLKGIINSLKADIVNLKELVSADYSTLLLYQIEDLTFNSWLDNKTNIQLSENIIIKIGRITTELKKTIEDLKEFKTEDDLLLERNVKDLIFKKYFKDYLDELKVKAFEDVRYLSLYKMKLFPKQGVELLKTLLAYYFAFNKTINSTPYVHRFPFVMDAIFKEDIDENNRGIILEFINRNKPKDTQILMSIAESKHNLKTALDYNKEFLNNDAKLILINTEEERSFLSNFDENNRSYLNDTLTCME